MIFQVLRISSKDSFEMLLLLVGSCVCYYVY